ncbi:unnamed protein product [Ceutorhynchus assimilis]|uniref:Uncharacterized protein n=1 Tax=Ceutorhynchus assimilis TaxID=467358 RepID=A0A9N9N3B1_9CUCU|nr:unnamed protein product [Ceutorhynchus assimilis]
METTELPQTKLCRVTQFIKLFVRTYGNTFNETCPNNEEGLSYEEYRDGIVELCFECAKPVYPLDQLEKIDQHKIIEKDEKIGNSELFCVECDRDLLRFVKPDECEFCTKNKV